MPTSSDHADSYYADFRAFRSGLRAACSLPPLMVCVAMIGFGSLAQSQGVSLMLSLLTAAGVYGMPGQIAMLELYATGSSLIAILVAVSMANMRFLPMSIALMPHFDNTGKLFRWRFVLIQLMSINSWTFFLQVMNSIPRTQRFGYFCGFGLVCFSLGLVGTAIGWTLAGNLSKNVTLSLIFLNPAYFVFLFSANRNKNIILSMFIGAVLGPLFFLVSAEWSLPVCGLIAGTLGYRLCRDKSIKTKAHT